MTSNAAPTHAAIETSTEAEDQRLFDTIAADYSQKDLVQSTRIAREYEILRCVQPTIAKMGRPKLILEVGCGVGRVARILKGRYDRYVGVDYSAKLIEAAKIYASDCPAEFVCANIKAFELSGQKADLTVLIGALHHMTEMDAVMASLIRNSAPEGRIVAFEPNRSNPIVQTLRRIRQRVDRAYSSDQHYFSRRELRALFARHGFKDIDVAHQGYCSTPFSQVILPPQFLTKYASRAAVGFDRLCDRALPRVFHGLSWNLVVSARFPEASPC